MTSSHNEWFSFYQVGFRCCKDAKGSAPVEPAAREVYIPRKQRMADPPPLRPAQDTSPSIPPNPPRRFRWP